MILEEAEKIDQVYEIMAILKTGYTRDGKVDRTNPVTLTAFSVVRVFRYLILNIQVA